MDTIGIRDLDHLCSAFLTTQGESISERAAAANASSHKFASNSGAARYESAPDPHLHRTAAFGWRRRPVTQVTMVRPFHRGPRGVMGLATKPDDQRKDDCSRQNASQDNLNKRKVDHYHVSWRWRGWRPWRSRRRRLRSHDHSCFASSLSKNLLAMLLEDPKQSAHTGFPAVLDDAGALA